MILANVTIDNKREISYKMVMSSNLSKRLKNYQTIASVVAKFRKQGKTIVFVNGCFDLLHFAHVLFLEKAKKFGDVLVVGISSDKVIKMVKGKNRPIYPEKVRAGLVASLASVDLVVIMKEKLEQGIDFHRLIEKIRPKVMVLEKGNSAIPATKALIEKYGGKLYLMGRQHPHISTSQIIKKISET